MCVCVCVHQHHQAVISFQSLHDFIVWFSSIQGAPRYCLSRVASFPSLPLFISPSLSPHLFFPPPLKRARTGREFRGPVPEAFTYSAAIRSWRACQDNSGTNRHTDTYRGQRERERLPKRTSKAFVCERAEGRRGRGEALVSGCIKRKTLKVLEMEK